MCSLETDDVQAYADQPGLNFVHVPRMSWRTYASIFFFSPSIRILPLFRFPELTVFDILKCKTLVLSNSALAALQHSLGDPTLVTPLRRFMEADGSEKLVETVAVEEPDVWRPKGIFDYPKAKNNRRRKAPNAAVAVGDADGSSAAASSSSSDSESANTSS